MINFTHLTRRIPVSRRPTTTTAAVAVDADGVVRRAHDFSQAHMYRPMIITTIIIARGGPRGRGPTMPADADCCAAIRAKKRRKKQKEKKKGRYIVPLTNIIVTVEIMKSKRFIVVRRRRQSFIRPALARHAPHIHTHAYYLRRRYCRENGDGRRSG